MLNRLTRLFRRRREHDRALNEIRVNHQRTRANLRESLELARSKGYEEAAAHIESVLREMKRDENRRSGS